MGDQSGIEWTDATFNPWIGCTKVSPACDNCYAEAWAQRYGDANWGAREPRRRTGEKNWNNPRRWQRQAAEWFAEYGRPRFVFCASLADVFDNAVPDEWRADLWNLIRECDQLQWLLLTKRPQNIAKMLPPDWGDGWPQVWLGTTVENQQVADRNIPFLLRVPSKGRFLSCEPIVGPIHIDHLDYIGSPAPGLHWIIAGGESGVGARPADPDWYRSLRDQSLRASLPFHFKQWGEFDATQIRVGKKKAGRILDGRTWDGRPDATCAAPPYGNGRAVRQTGGVG